MWAGLLQQQKVNKNILDYSCQYFKFKPSFYILKMTITYDQKLLLAKLVFDRKRIIMGAFGGDITKRAKNHAWEQIHEELKAHGVTATLDQLR